MTRMSVMLIGAVLVTACNATPLPGDPFPACDGGDPIYLPPRQGPDEFEASSLEAMACFAEAHEGGIEADLTFVALGVEGQEFDAMLRTHSDGTVDYFIEEEGAGATWQWACRRFAFVDPDLPDLGDCRDTPPD